jgi:hypothetical protein
MAFGERGIGERSQRSAGKGNTMSNDLWTFEVLTGDEPTTTHLDLAGYDVEAVDGHIGKVDEATYDVGASWVVVDTGFWIFGKKRMIPAGVITRIDQTNTKVHVDLTKDQIKQAPDLDAARRDDDDFRREHTDYYGRT